MTLLDAESPEPVEGAVGQWGSEGSKDMATWQVQITVRNIQQQKVAVVATRTNGEDVHTYVVPSALIGTPALKLAVMQNIRAQFVADEANRNAVATVIGTLEADAAAWLNAQEA